jgi:ABC-type sugar transport system permease subunit
MVILFLLPATLLYLCFFIYPSVKAFYISLFDWNGFTSKMDYIGLKNFRELFTDAYFWGVAFKNSLLIIFLGGVLVFVLAFMLSGILSSKIKGRKFFRGLLFFPYIINPVAIAILWNFIYNKQWGLLNNILKKIGLEVLQKTWTAPENLFWAILVALVWMYTGFYCVILLAALDQVPKGLIESANLDGASELQTFFLVKLPLIWDVLVTSIVLWVISAIKEFTLLYAWGGGIDIPPEGATNLAVHMFVTAFGRRVTIYRMGYATAMGVIMFIMVVLMYFLVSRIFKWEGIEKNAEF